MRYSLILVSIIALMGLVGCLSKDPYFGSTKAPDEQILRYLNAAEPRAIDPHKTDGSPENNIMINLYETLTVYDPKTLEPLPGVAERWEALDQSKRWIFYLRKNAKWTDGHAVTAHDFVWAWQRAVTPETAAPYVSLQFYIKNAEAISNGKMPASTLGVRALDDYTLEVEMERPTSFFVKMTPHYIFAPLPKWAIEQYGDKWTEPDHIVSNGPFKLKDHYPYDKVVLIKNPDYWDQKSVKLSQIIFYPISGSTALNLYKAGEADVMQSGMIPLAFTKALKLKQDYVKGIFFATQFYAVNVKRKPLDNRLVRTALNMAIDKRAITDKLLGKGDTPATAFIPPGIAGYPATNGPQYAPDEARKLLAEAGYPNGANFPKITISINSDDAIKQIAEAIQQMWKDVLNINVEIQSEEWQTLRARSERKDFDLMRASWNGDYLDPSTFLDLFATDTANNQSGWINSNYTDLLVQANLETDDAKRMQLFSTAEKLLIDDGSIIPLYYGALSYMKKPFVEGFYPNLIDVHPLKTVSINVDNLISKQ